jgi:hypothetical protein
VNQAMKNDTENYLKEFKDALVALGKSFEQCDKPLEEVCQQAYLRNKWFSRDQIEKSLKAWAEALKATSVDKWLLGHKAVADEKSVLVIAAGNIPLVSLHDILCVLACGHRLVLKPSTDDEVLPLKALDILTSSWPFLKQRIRIEKAIVKDFDCAIATGSNNSLRYFEYYFREKPHLLRGHRNSSAVLTGEESAEEMHLLGEDVFTYFGLGCRSVSHLYIPEEYNLQNIFKHWSVFATVAENTKYYNNYQYQRTVLLLNNVDCLENGFVLLRASDLPHSPVGVLHYSRYKNAAHLQQLIAQNITKTQCIIGRDYVPFGASQRPTLWDYADGVNTLQFLLSLT